jgi:hypothetical protein
VSGRSPGRPALRVVRGEPDPEELAALVAVLARLAATRAARRPAPPPRAGRWGDPAAALRRPLRPSPGAWAAAARGPGVRTRAR